MRWVNLFILALLAIGHAEIVVTLFNRINGFRLRCGTLSRLRALHDLMLPGMALIIVLFVGLSGPRLLAGGSWADVPAGWRLWFGVCALGLVSLLVSSVRWLLRRPPGCQAANHASVVDIAERLGRRPVEPGPLRLFTRIPGNEIFQVEVAEKTFVLPRLPPAWDGLSILHLSDLHFIGTLGRAFFEQVIEVAGDLAADVAVFTGDLLDRQDLAAWVPATLGRIEAPLGRYFILGNHDWFLDPEATRRAVDEAGWQSVAGRNVVIEHRGHMLAIGGTERPWMGAFPLTTHNFSILLSHTPDHIGWARRHGVDLMLAGHCHGGQVVLPVIGPVYSPSRYGVRYAGGAYWEPPTLLHVSRGISGKHPLRWNCRPEVTKLVLRTK